MVVDKEKRYQIVIKVHFPDVSSISRAIRHILLRLKSGISALRRFIVLPPKWFIWAISFIVVIVAQFTRLAVLEDKTRLAYGYSILVMTPESVEHLVLGSAFRQLNTIGWIVTKTDVSVTYRPEPKYSPLMDIADTQYLLDFGGEFIGSRSHAQTLSIMGRIDRRERDRMILSIAGTNAAIAVILAGLLDPLMLLSVLIMVRGFRIVHKYLVGNHVSVAEGG